LDRHTLGVAELISKGKRIQFVQSGEVQQAVQWGLNMGNDRTYIAAHPGEVMGAFAWGHPFLEGNGRAMVVSVQPFHLEL